MRESDSLTMAQLAAWRAFLEAYARVTTALDRQLADAGCGLDLREYDLLVLLSEAGPAGLRLRDLAERALISRSNVTRRAEALAGRGLVERRPDPEDGRGVIATITAAGTRSLRRAATVHLPGVKRLVFSEPTPDLDELRRFFDQIAADANDDRASSDPPTV